MQAHVADLTMSQKSIIEFYDSRPTLGRNMIGVILWSDAADQKAVIWCEDQGDLAYLSDTGATHLPDQFFDVGDVVEFDVHTDRNTRLARNASLVKQNWGTSLSDGLHAMSNDGMRMVGSSDTAEIIPFRVDHATRPLPTNIPRQKRQG